jgi:chemotaxis protein CheD
MPQSQSSLTGFEKRVVVGIADVAVSNNTQVTLTTYSLGSCVGVAIYDPFVRVGGMMHAMLPYSSLDLEKSIARPAMFVDTGLPLLIETMEELRAERRRWKVYVAGGAQIMDNSGFFSIGKRNYQALVDALARENLKIEAEQVGGLVNRTMHLNIATGGLTLKVSGQAKDFSLCKS